MEWMVLTIGSRGAGNRTSVVQLRRILEYGKAVKDREGLGKWDPGTRSGQRKRPVCSYRAGIGSEGSLPFVVFPRYLNGTEAWG
jgi:hypothetical protein